MDLYEHERVSYWYASTWVPTPRIMKRYESSFLKDAKRLAIARRRIDAALAAPEPDSEQKGKNE